LTCSFHVVFYSKIGEEKGAFDVADVCNAISDKLIFRHPHVFGETKVNDPATVAKTWEQIKLKEKGGNKDGIGRCARLPPSMVKAYRIQDKARNYGFDWDQRKQVWDKVREEIGELEKEIGTMDDDRMEAEFGDLLFAIINAARLYGVNPDNALERTNRTFIRRFTYMEKRAKEAGRDLRKMTLDEMEAIWQEAKREERRNSTLLADPPSR